MTYFFFFLHMHSHVQIFHDFNLKYLQRSQIIFLSFIHHVIKIQYFIFVWYMIYYLCFYFILKLWNLFHKQKKTIKWNSFYKRGKMRRMTFMPWKIELSSQVESRLFLRERLSPQAIQSKFWTLFPLKYK